MSTNTKRAAHKGPVTVSSSDRRQRRWIFGQLFNRWWLRKLNCRLLSSKLRIRLFWLAHLIDADSAAWHPLSFVQICLARNKQISVGNSICYVQWRLWGRAFRRCSVEPAMICGRPIQWPARSIQWLVSLVTYKSTTTLKVTGRGVGVCTIHHLRCFNCRF